jgi:hypothetical protein
VHRSRLYGIFIDTPVDQAASSADFWSAALAAPAHAVPGEEHFTVLTGGIPDLTLAVQAVDDSPRYHVDIETDDVQAEVARLTALGAVEVSQWLECHVLRAPRWAPPVRDPGTQRDGVLRSPRPNLGVIQAEPGARGATVVQIVV